MNPRVRRPLTLARLAGHRADGESERPGTAWLAGHRPDGARTAWESGRGGSGTHLRADRPFALRAVPMPQAFRHERIVNSL